jgi:predicted GH43/DUF377 family glycosyl hydrolase
MIYNLSKLVLEQGGSLIPLIIPSELTGGTGIMNPSIFLDNDELKLNIRHVGYTLYHSEGEQKFQNIWGPLAYLNPEDDITLRTTNYLCTLNPNTLEIETVNKVDTSKLDKEPLWEFIGLEDGRVIKWDNKLFLCGVRRDTTTNGEGRMEFSEIVNNKEVSRHRIQPPLGPNSSYCEKNWMPIIDMPYHFVKWSNPSEIVKVDLKTNTSKTVKLNEHVIPLERDLRGGSHVITIGKYRVAITHEVDLWNNEIGNKDCHYYHRFIIWDMDWNIVKVSEDFKFMTGYVEFACGLSLHKNNLLISFGFQDNAAYILKTPIQFLENLLDIEFNIDHIPTYIPTSKILVNFVEDPYSQITNFYLAYDYDKKGQTASALSYYLRSAEYGYGKDLVYESLIKMGKCLGKQGRRQASEKGIYLNAINYNPQRPEAYFVLSQYYESRKEWFDAYTMANIGLQYIDNSSPTLTNIDYPGNYGLLFQKAVSSWWIGQTNESRKLFSKLKDNYINKMNDFYKNLVHQNINSIGTNQYPFIEYKNNKHSELLYKFNNSEKIKKNYSQNYQDMFVLTMLNGKTNGTYLEIGAADPFKGNNTALLEQDFKWKGASIEISEYESNKFKNFRKNPIYTQDATKIDYNKFLSELNLGTDIDYLQLDCDPPSVTYDILTKIPFDKYRFAVITFEHDYYADITKSYRDKSREFLFSKGYILIASNIAPDSTSSFEDWWVHPELISKDIINIMIDNGGNVKNAQEYMLNKKIK